MHFEGEGRGKSQRRCCYEPVLPSSFKLRHHMILLIFLVLLSIQLQLQPLPLSTRPFPPTANDDESDGNPRTTGKPGKWLPTLLLIADLSTQHDGHNNNKDGNQVRSPPPHCSALTRPRSTTTDNDATTTRRGNQVHSPPPYCSALTTMTVTRPA